MGQNGGEVGHVGLSGPAIETAADSVLADPGCCGPAGPERARKGDFSLFSITVGLIKATTEKKSQTEWSQAIQLRSTYIKTTPGMMSAS